jgi:hypothetical protein
LRYGPIRFADETLFQTDAAITQNGFYPAAALDDPSWLYTVGLHETWSQPELIVFGLCPDKASGGISAVVDEIRAGLIRTTLVVPFPHRMLGFVPANCVTFRGHTEVVPLSDEHGRRAFTRRRILRDNMKWLKGSDALFLKLTPDPKVNCYGLGISLREIRRNHTAGGYSVTIPASVRGRS